jgi:hypothetical protein
MAGVMDFPVTFTQNGCDVTGSITVGPNGTLVATPGCPITLTGKVDSTGAASGTWHAYCNIETDGATSSDGTTDSGSWSLNMEPGGSTFIGTFGVSAADMVFSFFSRIMNETLCSISRTCGYPGHRPCLHRMPDSNDTGKGGGFRGKTVRCYHRHGLSPGWHRPELFTGIQRNVLLGGAPGIAPPLKTLQIRSSDPDGYSMDELVAWG